MKIVTLSQLPEKGALNQTLWPLSTSLMLNTWKCYWIFTTPPHMKSKQVPLSPGKNWWVCDNLNGGWTLIKWLIKSLAAVGWRSGNSCLYSPGLFHCIRFAFHWKHNVQSWAAQWNDSLTPTNIITLFLDTGKAVLAQHICFCVKDDAQNSCKGFCNRSELNRAEMGSPL